MPERACLLQTRHPFAVRLLLYHHVLLYQAGGAKAKAESHRETGSLFHWISDSEFQTLLNSNFPITRKMCCQSALPLTSHQLPQSHFDFGVMDWDPNCHFLAVRPLAGLLWTHTQMQAPHTHLNLVRKTQPTRAPTEFCRDWVELEYTEYLENHKIPYVRTLNTVRANAGS